MQGSRGGAEDYGLEDLEATADSLAEQLLQRCVRRGEAAPLALLVQRRRLLEGVVEEG